MTQREVEAQHLVNYGRRWYLLAWDLGRQDWRTLRVDRMGVVRELPGAGLHRRTPAPPDVMVRQAVSQAPFALQATVRLAGGRAELEGRPSRGGTGVAHLADELRPHFWTHLGRR